MDEREGMGGRKRVITESKDEGDIQDSKTNVYK